MSNNGNNSVSVINLGTNKATGIIGNPNFSSPNAIAFTADGASAYIGNLDPRTGSFMSIIDAQNDVVTPMGEVADGNFVDVSGIAITPDPTAYATNFAGSNISIVDVATNTATGFVSDPGNRVIGPLAIAIIRPVIITTTITGCRKENIFLTQIEYINLIRWQTPTNFTAVEYQLFRDAALTDLAGTVSATDQLVFQDHNRDPNIKYTYYLVGVTDTGSSTTLGNVTITTKCG